MITLRIDDQTFTTWREQAAARGLSVEDWLKAETASRSADAGTDAGRVPADDPPLPGDAWAARLRAFAQRHRPTGLPLDDSRKNIYD